VRENYLSKSKNTHDKQRLDLIKAHILSGFYNRQEIVAATAGAVLKSQALHLLLDRYELYNAIPQEPQDRTDTRKLKLAEIKRRIDDGFYDDPNNLAELAERIISRMGLD
jgi:anti-sigma28 factor (negative regulator of flagellin synthesis)